MKKLIGILTIMLVTLVGWSQQVIQFSNYLQNPYLINTAFAGRENQIDLTGSFRKQWVGIDDSPTTYYVSLNAPITKRTKLVSKGSVRISNVEKYMEIKPKAFHAMGAMVLRDQWGLYSRTRAQVSYAYHLPVSRTYTLSFSPNVSFTQFAFNGGDVVIDNQNDDTYQNYLANWNNASLLDINASVLFYSKKLFVGYSQDQLLRERLALSSSDGTGEFLRVNHFFTAGYKFRLNRDWEITPSTYAKYVSGISPQYDINLRFDYQDRIWTGATWRQGGTVALMVGAYINNQFRIGYATDISFSALQQYNAGSHEIVLGIIFRDNKKRATF